MLECHAQELAEYWQNKFDWRRAEAGLNKFKNYELEVNSIEVSSEHHGKGQHPLNGTIALESICS